MRNFKKVVAATLALLMLALSVNVSFAAEEYSEAEAIAVAKVNAAGVMTGTDKGFEPSKTLTRAEAAAIMVRMKGISEATVKQSSGNTLFTDVAASHWAAGYVNVASNYGIIVGVGANKFAPEKEVSVAEFYTMAVRALGAGKLVDSEGTWPTNYVNFAIENDLAEDVAQVYTQTSTRLTAAIIVANTLSAKLWEKSTVKSNGEITWQAKDKTILEDVLKINEYRNAVFNMSSVSTKELSASFTGNLYAVAEDLLGASDTISGNVAKEAGLGSVKAGQSYTVWYKPADKEILGFWIPTTTECVNFTSIKSVSLDAGKVTKIKLVVDGSEKEYDVLSATEATAGSVTRDITINDVSTSMTWETVADYVNGTNSKTKPTNNMFGTAYFSSANGKATKLEDIYVEFYNQYAVVESVTDKKISFKSALGQTGLAAIYVDNSSSSNKEYFVTKDGKGIEISDIEADDVIFYYVNGNKYFINVYTDTVEGRISSKSGNDVKIDGKKYEVKGVSVNAGDEGTFYLNEDGKIVMFIKEKGAVGSVATIAAHRISTDAYSTAKTVELRLNLADGTLTEWLELDPEACYKSGTDYYNLAAMLVDASSLTATATHNSNESTAKAYGQTEIDKITTNALLQEVFPLGGAIVCKVSDDVTLQENSDKLNVPNSLYQTVVSDHFEDAAKDYVTVASINITGGRQSDVKFYARNDVQAYELDKNNKTAEPDKLWTIKEVNFEDVDDNNNVMFIGDLDYTDHTFGLIYFTTANVKTTKQWAFVLTKAEYDDNDSTTKENYAYDVVYAGSNEVKTLLSEKSDVTNDIFELNIKDSEILKDVKSTGFNDGRLGVVIPDAYTRLAKQYSNGTVTMHKAQESAVVGAEGAALELAEDLIVVKYDASKSKYTVSSFDSIGMLEKGTGASDVVSSDDVKNAKEIACYYTWTDTKTNDVEVIAIVYFDKDVTPAAATAVTKTDATTLSGTATTMEYRVNGGAWTTCTASTTTLAKALVVGDIVEIRTIPTTKLPSVIQVIEVTA